MFPNLPSEIPISPIPGRETAGEAVATGGGLRAFLLEFGSASRMHHATQPQPTLPNAIIAAISALLSPQAPTGSALPPEANIDPQPPTGRVLSALLPGHKPARGGDGPVADEPQAQSVPFINPFSIAPTAQPLAADRAHSDTAEVVRQASENVTISPESAISSILNGSAFKRSERASEASADQVSALEVAIVGRVPEPFEALQVALVSAPKDGGAITGAQAAGAAAQVAQPNHAAGLMWTTAQRAKQAQLSASEGGPAPAAEPLPHIVRMGQPDTKQLLARQFANAREANAQGPAPIPLAREPQPQGALETPLGPQPAPSFAPKVAPEIATTSLIAPDISAATPAPTVAAPKAELSPDALRPERPAKAVAAVAVAAAIGAAPPILRATDAIAAPPQANPADISPRRGEAAPIPTSELSSRPIVRAPAAASPADITAEPMADASKIVDAPGFDPFALPQPLGRPEIPMTHGHLPASAHAPSNDLTRGVGLQLAEAASRFPDRPIELTLAPEELGRVRISFSPADSGLSMNVSADRPETLNLLRRNIDQLAQDFRELGYTNISFSFQQQHEGKPDVGRAPQPQEQDDTAIAPTSVAGPKPTPRPAAGTSRGLDLRV